MTDAPENAELKRMDAAGNFPKGTCPASRHVAMMARALVEGGSYSMLQEDPDYAGECIAAVVASLWEARAAIAERDAVIEGLVEALEEAQEWNWFYHPDPENEERMDDLAPGDVIDMISAALSRAKGGG